MKKSERAGCQPSRSFNPKVSVWCIVQEFMSAMWVWFVITAVSSVSLTSFELQDLLNRQTINDVSGGHYL